VVEDGEVWICPDRGHYNGVVRKKCWVCGAERGEAELRPRPPGSTVSHTGMVRERADSTDKPVPYRTVLGPLQVLDGVGWAPRVGQTVSLILFGDHFELGYRSFQFSELRDLQVEGHSIVKGGGFFGGGFGVTGALEGIAAAAALNAVTTKRRKWVTISLAAADGWVTLRYDGADESEVRGLLRPLADAAFAANQRRAQPPTAHHETPETDIVTQLERLARLHETGALSDQEFVLAKNRLLSRPGDT
jgi:hypothetical protein